MAASLKALLKQKSEDEIKWWHVQPRFLFQRNIQDSNQNSTDGRIPEKNRGRLS